MAKVIIRPMRFLDINQVIEVNQKCLPENYNKVYLIDKFQKENAKNHSFVAECSKNIIGYIFCNDEMIISFAIYKEFRNKKIGTELLCHCLNTLSEVKLQVRVSNNIAIELYNKLGFTFDTKIDNYYSNPTEDGYILKYKNDMKYPIDKKLKC